jgi:hypothetical protein
MLAAASSRSDRALESVKLVLLLESKNLEYPETLKTYFKTVVQQTIDLLNRPNEVASQALPEAVSLAVKMASDQHLHDLIQEIVGEEDMSSDQAEKALSSLETPFDPTCESAHFSKEIYAAI